MTTAPSDAKDASAIGDGIVVLVSGSGTLLRALLDATTDPAYGVRILAVGADRPCAGIERAERAGIPTFVCRPADFATRDDWDAALAAHLAEVGPRLVVTAGFMRILGAAALGGQPVINMHPALLPSFPGAHGVRDALAYGVTVTGATCHVVDSGVDTGPIIEQRAVEVTRDDTEHSLHERIKAQERAMIVRIVRRLAREGFAVEGRRVRIGTDLDGPRPTLTDLDQFRDSRSAWMPTSADGRRQIRRALVSVYDKASLDELARALGEAGVSVVSTGSTASTISAAGVPVTTVEELTGFPECLDGRVKTLHPKVHAGILADTCNPEHLQQLTDLDVEPFDLVVVNLYPFAETVASGSSPDECVEQIDIGGPAMVRAAAKNHASVAVVTSPAAYGQVVEALGAGGFTLAQRQRLAAEAFVHTAAYDTAVANWMGTVLTDTSDGTGFPAWTGAGWHRAAGLRYGENPHQRAALYRYDRPGVASAEQLHGKEMSYNNYVDTDAAVRAAHDHGDRPTVAVVKHANPCGIAVGATIEQAYARAHATDPVSAFGGVVAANRVVTAAMAEQVKDVFTEVIIAPDFDDDALAILQGKKNIRILRLPGGMAAAADPLETRAITGGLLVQTVDRIDAVVGVGGGDPPGGDDAARWRLAAGQPADEATLADLQFAWRAIRAVKSNAILLARDGAAVGIGMGQVNRVDSCHLAVRRAGSERARGSVAASDAFFPFADGLQLLIDAGVRAVVAPGGSIRDDEVIAAAATADVTMYFTGIRHFAH